nr:olfactory receptor 88 [Tropidothorax elegans]
MSNVSEVNFSTKWCNAVVNLITVSTPSVCSFIIIQNRDNIQKLSMATDAWWQHTLFQKETSKMKEKSHQQITKFIALYSMGMYSGLVMFLTLPLGKFLLSQNKLEPVELLPYATWTPLPLDSWWGFCATFVFEVLAITFVFLGYTRLMGYIGAVIISISYQMELMGEAFIAIEGRVGKLLERQEAAKETGLYLVEMKREVKSSAMHYHELFKKIKLISTVNNIMLNFTYHAGMWILCLTAVQITSDLNGKLLMAKSLIFFINAMMSIFMSSITSEFLITKTEKLRESLYNSNWYNMPITCQKDYLILQLMLLHPASLKTIIGTQASMENFSKLLNTSYCYFSLIIAMK